MEWNQGVAMQLTLNTLRRRGQLNSRGFTGTGLRAALLADLALVGLLEDAQTIDCEPTGFPPADVLIAAIESEPTYGLATWLGRGPVVHRLLAEEWIRVGRWSVRRGVLTRRYVDLDDPSHSQVTGTIRRWAASIDEGRADVSAAEACCRC